MPLAPTRSLSAEVPVPHIYISMGLVSSFQSGVPICGRVTTAARTLDASCDITGH